MKQNYNCRERLDPLICKTSITRKHAKNSLSTDKSTLEVSNLIFNQTRDKISATNFKMKCALIRVTECLYPIIAHLNLNMQKSL